MSNIPLYTQTTPDWHCSKNQHPKPNAVDLNVGTNEYIFGRVTPDNKFVVTTGLVKDPNGIKMVGGKKKPAKSKSKTKTKSKSKKGGNVYSSGKTSLASYNKENYTHNELIYNALDKINQLNGLGADRKNSMINASNNIVGGKRTKRTMKGGEESWGATGMPAQFYGAKLPSKVSSKTTVQPNDSAVVNLAPLKGGRKTKGKMKGGLIQPTKHGSIYVPHVNKNKQSKSPLLDYKDQLPEKVRNKINIIQLNQLLFRYNLDPALIHGAPNNPNNSPNTLNKITSAAGPMYQLEPLIYMGKLASRVKVVSGNLKGLAKAGNEWNTNFSKLKDVEKEVYMANDGKFYLNKWWGVLTQPQEVMPITKTIYYIINNKGEIEEIPIDTSIGPLRIKQNSNNKYELSQKTQSSASPYMVSKKGFMENKTKFELKSADVIQKEDGVLIFDVKNVGNGSNYSTMGGKTKKPVKKLLPKNQLLKNQ